jgi:sulfur carrier protein
MIWNPEFRKFCANLIQGLEKRGRLEKDGFIPVREAFLNILVNGENKQITESISLEDLIQQLGVRKETVVAEVNRQIVQLDKRSGLKLADGDQVELIQFVGGG